MEDFILGKAGACFKYINGICDSQKFVYFLYTQEYFLIETRHDNLVIRD